MKILFYGTKNYDEQFFEKLLPEFPDIKIKFIEANIHEETASLAKGYEAICAFVNADLGAPVIVLDLRDIMGNTGHEGLHLACMGEAWQAAECLAQAMLG